MKSRYRKQQEDKFAKYKRKKAGGGVVVAEKPQQQSTGSIAKSAGSSALNAYQAAGGGLTGAIAGVGAGALTIGGAIADNKKAEREANRMRQAEENLTALEAGHHTPFQKNPYMARRGRNQKLAAEIIEMEKDELHITEAKKGYKVKKEGKTPHEKGGDLTSVKPGEFIVPTQLDGDGKYDKKRVEELVALSQEGDEDAIKRIDAIKKELPTDEEIAEDGVYNEVSTPDNEILYEPDYKEVTDYDGKWDYRLDNYTGRTEVRKKGEDKWMSPDMAWGKKNTNEPGSLTNMELTRQRVFPDWKAATGSEDEAPLTGFREAMGAMPVNPQGEDTEGGDETLSPEKPSTDNSKPRGRMGEGFDWNRLAGHSNILHNMARSREAIDPYQITPLKLNRYKHEDFSPRALREAERMAKVNQDNLRRTAGSRGQINAQAMQNEIALSRAKADILADEVARRTQTRDKNVDLSNVEAQHLTKEQMTAKEENRQAREKRKAYMDAAMREGAELANIRRQEEFMRKKDAREAKMDAILANLLHQNAGGTHRTSGKLMDEYGNINVGASDIEFKSEEFGV